MSRTADFKNFWCKARVLSDNVAKISIITEVQKILNEIIKGA